MSHSGMTADEAKSYEESITLRVAEENSLPEWKIMMSQANMAVATLRDAVDTLRDVATKMGLGFGNILCDTDSYKASHYRQYPQKTEQVYSYIESRGGSFDRTVFFGLQAYLKRYLSMPITTAKIDEAQAFWAMHGEPFDRSIWEHIIEKHSGRLPVEISALPEGLVVPTKTVLVTITNTDPACFWLPSFLETALLRAVWYPTTVATISHACKAIIKGAYDRTSDDPSGLNFKLHDFGARGVSSQESAALGGMAHLVNFRGTDTVSGVLAARLYYGEEMAGFSIPASEHSTITSWGKDREADAYRNMLRQFGDGVLMAIVSDSYDIYHAVSHIYGVELKQEILEGKPTVVVRPDSGDPTIVPIEVIKRLDKAFGHTVNAKGYRVLHPKVRVIQGDGITFETLRSILWNLHSAGYAIDNLGFGMGGGLLQKCDRDTLKFAMKCSAIKIKGVWQDVYKAPVGQPDKASKRGRFIVMETTGGEFVNINTNIDGDDGSDEMNLLKPVWCDGVLLVDHTLAEVRDRADSALQGVSVGC